jgi:hypothetical protein
VKQAASGHRVCGQMLFVGVHASLQWLFPTKDWISRFNPSRQSRSIGLCRLRHVRPRSRIRELRARHSRSLSSHFITISRGHIALNHKTGPRFSALCSRESAKPIVRRRQAEALSILPEVADFVRHDRPRARSHRWRARLLPGDRGSVAHDPRPALLHAHMVKPPRLATETMCADAGLHADQARRRAGELAST